MTPNSRFSEFLRDIEPSATTKSNSVSAHSSVRDALFGDDEFGSHADRILLGGSYKRNTAIRPRQKNGSLDRPDVDLYAVVDVPLHETTPSDEVEALYAALNRARETLGITKLKRNRVSLSVSMNKADLDVSVLIRLLIERNKADLEWDGLYRIGNRETGEWYRTDPEAHTSWSSEQNTRFSGRFKPMTKLVKWARRENPTRYKHPKSFAIEGFLAANLDETETHYGKLFHSYSAAFVDAYVSNRLAGTCPWIEDPAVPGQNILARVGGDDFCAYYDKIEEHRDDAALALDEEDQDRATTYWRRIFGPRFPAPKSANASMLKPATTMSPLTFGSTRAAPSKRPAKFA